MLREILLLCLAGGVCALDATAAWQIMLSQPLVSGTIAGLLLGAPQAGVVIGLVLQLLWSGAIPVGARPLPDAPVGSVSGVWFTVTLLRTSGSASPSLCYLLGVIAALCVALLGRRTIMLEREISGWLFRRLVHRVSSGQVGCPERTVPLAVIFAFARGFLLCLLAIGVLALAVSSLTDDSTLSIRDYSLTLLILEAVGAGVLFSVFVGKSRGRVLAFAGGIAGTFLVVSLFHQ